MKILIFFILRTKIYKYRSCNSYEPERLGWIRYCSRYGRRRIPWLCRTRTWSRPVDRDYRSSNPPSPGRDRYRNTFWNYQAPFCHPSADPGHGAARRPNARHRSRRRIPFHCPFYRPGASSRTPRRLWEEKSRYDCWPFYRWYCLRFVREQVIQRFLFLYNRYILRQYSVNIININFICSTWLLMHFLTPSNMKYKLKLFFLIFFKKRGSEFAHEIIYWM